MPQLKVRSNSSSAMPPCSASHLNTGSTGSRARSMPTPRWLGRTRGMVAVEPPPGRGADPGVRERDVGPRQQAAAFGGADREAAEVVIAVLVEAGHFGGLAADQRAAGLPAAFRDARDDRRGGF